NSQVRRSFPSVALLSTSELWEWVQCDTLAAPILHDSRAREEYDVSHLQGAFPAPTLATALKKLSDVGKDQSIVTYCSVGYRSGALAEQLQAAGYTRVYNLSGSIFQWANEGRPVYRGPERVSEVHPYNRAWGVLLDRNLWSRRSH
ncbi:MAG: rhodanese-like domain-containing protein, partial [Acidimicrobiia bacterium]|nr:rhodanese-like domain-containing protein [Acidimicrobiia bacterium]